MSDIPALFDCCADLEAMCAPDGIAIRHKQPGSLSYHGKGSCPEEVLDPPWTVYEQK